MSLTLLVIIVAAGITAVVLAVHLTGGTRTLALDDADAARRRFADDFADLDMGDVWLTEDRTAAFFDLGGGRAGVVAALGDKYLTRVLDRAATEVDLLPDGRTITLAVDDFTWRGGSFTFASAADAQAVKAMLARSQTEVKGAGGHG